MAKKKEKDQEDDVAMTTGNDGEVTPDAEETNPTETPDAEETKSDAPDPESEPETPVGESGEGTDPTLPDPRENDEAKSKDEEINEVGTDAPTVSDPLRDDPEKFLKINRAAILYVARMTLDSGALEDMKTLFPSLFE